MINRGGKDTGKIKEDKGELVGKGNKLMLKREWVKKAMELLVNEATVKLEVNRFVFDTKISMEDGTNFRNVQYKANITMQDKVILKIVPRIVIALIVLIGLIVIRAERKMFENNFKKRRGMVKQPRDIEAQLNKNAAKVHNKPEDGAAKEKEPEAFK